MQFGQRVAAFGIDRVQNGHGLVASVGGAGFAYQLNDFAADKKSREGIQMHLG